MTYLNPRILDFASIDARLAQDTFAYTSSLAQIIERLGPGDTSGDRYVALDPHDLSRPSTTVAQSQGALPFSAPVRGGRRCELLARARDSVRHKSVKIKRAKNQRMRQKFTPGFESQGTTPAWVNEITEDGVREGRYLEGFEERQRAARKRVAEQKRREEIKSRKDKGTACYHTGSNSHGIEQGGHSMQWPLRNRTSTLPANAAGPALQFNDASHPLLRTKSAPGWVPSAQTSISSRMERETKTVTSHDWESSLIGGYKSPSNQSCNRSIHHHVNPPEQTPQSPVKTRRFAEAFPDGVTVRSVSSCGLSTMSEPRLVHHHPSSIYNDSAYNSTADLDLYRNYSLPVDSAAEDGAKDHAVFHRQSEIDAGHSHRRSIESFAKRVGWKQALPRALEEGKAKVQRLRRRSQPWRTQPAEVRHRESRDVVAMVRGSGSSP